MCQSVRYDRGGTPPLSAYGTACAGLPVAYYTVNNPSYLKPGTFQHVTRRYRPIAISKDGRVVRLCFYFAMRLSVIFDMVVGILLGTARKIIFVKCGK